MSIVAFDNAAFTSQPASAHAISLLLTATAGTVLLVASHGNEGTSISTIEVAGVNLGKLGRIVGGTGTTELWGLTTPATGVLTINATLVGASGTQMIWCLGAATYTGCRTTATPFGTAVVASAAASLLATITIASTASDTVAIAWGLSAVPAVTLGIGQTERGSATHSTSGKLVWGDHAGETSLTLSATSVGTADWAVVAVNLIHSNSALAVQSWKYTLGMMGVGR